MARRRSYGGGGGGGSNMETLAIVSIIIAGATLIWLYWQTLTAAKLASSTNTTNSTTTADWVKWLNTVYPTFGAMIPGGTALVTGTAMATNLYADIIAPISWAQEIAVDASSTTQTAISNLETWVQQQAGNLQLAW